MSKNKKKLALFISIFVAILGFWLLTAPARERRQVEANQQALLEEIQEMQTTPTATPQALSPLYQEDEIYNDTAEVYEDSEIISAYYEEYYTAATSYYQQETAILYIPIGTPLGVLRIDKIGLELPIIEGTTIESLLVAPGRVVQTAQIGQRGNAVIAGHRNYTFGTMFNRLDELEIGDIIKFICTENEEMTFAVFEKAVIDPEDQIAFIQPKENSIITLYTCTPVNIATHRLIVRAIRGEDLYIVTEYTEYEEQGGDL